MAEAILPDNTVDDFRSWIGDIQLRRWLIIEGLRIFLVIAGLSLAVATIEVLALVSQLQSMVGAAANAGGLGGTYVTQLVVTQWSLTYFGAHLTPIDLGLAAGGMSGIALTPLAPLLAGVAGQSGSLSGLGSLTLTAVVVGLGFRSGRRLELRAPRDGSAALSALRAAMVAVPYTAASLALFVAGHWQLSVGGRLLVNAAPAPIALITPLLVLGLAAAAGAVWARPNRTGTEAALLRGSGLGLLALLAGIVATVAIAIAVALMWLVASQAGQSQPASTSPAPGQSQGSGEVGWSGLLLVVLVLLLAGLYVLNGAAGLWAANLSFLLLNLGPLAVAVLAGPVAGALWGGVCLRPLTDLVEHGAFVLTFAGGSFVLAAASQLTLFGSAFGASPGVVLLVAGMLAAGSAALGGSLARTSLGRAVAAWPPLAAPVARLDERLARIVEPARRPARAPAVTPPAAGLATGCASCGSPVPEETAFCGRCGARVRPSPACAACGGELGPEDAFCSGCGARDGR